MPTFAAKTWNKIELMAFGKQHAARLRQFGVLSQEVKMKPLRLTLALKGEADRLWQLIDAVALDDDLKSLPAMPVQIIPFWNEGAHGVLCTAFNEDLVPV